MFNNYDVLKKSRESVNDHIKRYRLFGKTTREKLISSRRFRTI